jgi:cellulose synthase/poly-beta-1,6-N-acetylglucosamine synthase-like glycosyltransferase/peptidoglycan/xylan/chitin deacetylase (PgdA/CDA1 family)
VLLGLSALAAALVAQHQLTAGAAGAGSATVGPVAGYGTVLADSRGQPAWLTARPGTVSLTFSAGSGGDVAPQITAALRRLRVPGTFFVQPARAAGQRAIIGQQVASGDVVGLACPAWPGLVWLPGWWLGAALTSAQYQLQRAGDPAAALVQLPWADTMSALDSGAVASARRLAGLGYPAVLADLSAGAASSPRDVLRALLPGGPAPAGRGPGLVLALADTGRPGLAALRALPDLVAALRGSGYRFTTVPVAFGLTIQPARVPPLTAAGAATVLHAAQLAITVSSVLEWIFLATIGFVVGRMVVLLITSALHKRRDRLADSPCPDPVSVIIPAYNERAGIVRCLRSMLFCDCPDVEVILVDDGSTDGTADVVEDLGLPVTVVRQRNAGKAAALNAGIRHARHQLLVLADGDTVFEPTTISALVAPFRDPRVGAVAGNVKVANRRGVLGKVQHTEYVTGCCLDRRMYDVFGCMVTIPGAVGAFRREALAGTRGVPGDTLAEDTDVTIAVVETGWRVRYSARARAWTEAPSTLGQLWTQRHRWSYGTLQSLWKHRRTPLSPSGRRAMAWIGLPYLFVISCVLPVVSPVTDTYLLIELWADPWRAAVMLSTYLGVQGTLTLTAFVLDKERLRDLWTVAFQEVFYRQLQYLVALHSMASAATGVRLPWHKLARTGISVSPGEVAAGKQT